MKQRRFQQVDVFSTTPYMGNPVAVVLDAEGLSDHQMAQFANWTNLSETTFVLPPIHPEADYRVRIFTPSQELPFAGHPTLGTCHAWLQAGGKPKATSIYQDCAAGLIEIRQEGDILSFAAPVRRKTGPLDRLHLDQIISGLNLTPEDVLDHQWCDNGPPWQALLLRDATLVLNARPDPAIIKDVEFLGLVGPAAQGPHAFEIRAFFPGQARFSEDPVTGSLNAAVAQWLVGQGLAPPRYEARQGTVLGRDGRIFVTTDPSQQIWIGGACIACIVGQVML